MNRLPNELIQKILNYAMIRDVPFCMEELIRVAKAEENKKESGQHSHSHLWKARSEDNEGLEDGKRATVGVVERDKHTKDKRTDTEEGRIETQNASLWVLYDKVDHTQRPHLLDWHLVVGTCKRFRKLGKEAFFTSKIFAMEPGLVEKLQKSQLTRISTDDQQTALKYISSVVFLENNLQSASSLLTLPRRVSVFSRLVRLDHIFGYRSGEPVDWIVRAARDRKQAPSHFTDALASIGVPTNELEMGIMVCPGTTWDNHEGHLKRHIYPIIQIKANMKAKRDATNST